ncbi:MAG: hypothetical protein FVQ81_13660 [Candidatus Glassbacteria bacterium]|nr:hypothetical protein [Candidatus Glassbacteria bacterium]
MSNQARVAEQQIIQFSERLSERLEQLVLPLVEPGQAEKKQLDAAQVFSRNSQAMAERVFGMLDHTRDLHETRVLVLENGTGYLARKLAENGEVDVVSTAPTEALAELASRLNPYPNIIYRSFNPYPTTEEFDLIVGTGIIACYPKDTARLLLQSLTAFCRRKIITELPLYLPWFRRLFRWEKVSVGSEGGLELSRFNRKELFDLIENSCGLLISEHRTQQGKMIFKAIRKVHRMTLS